MKQVLSVLLVVGGMVGVLHFPLSGNQKAAVIFSPIPHITLEPETVYPGDPVFITLDTPSKPTALLWNNKQIPTFIYEGKYRALIPIPFEEKNAEYVVAAKLEDGSTLAKTLVISPRKKIERPLGIPEKLGGNTPKAATNLVNNLAKENKILNTVTTATTTLWSRAFGYPVKKVVITDDYGYSRATVNQTITHKGTDFRAQVGTEVFAMNKGIVRLARPFAVYGNSVVIDHGLGVQTLYMHLSRLDVKEGDVVEKGRLIGLSGDTGYTDAPHLHISVKINGISIDPMTFVKFFVK